MNSKIKSKVITDCSIYYESLGIYYGPGWALTTAYNLFSVTDNKLRSKQLKMTEVITPEKLESVKYYAGKYIPAHALEDIYVNFDLMDEFCSIDPWAPSMCCYCTRSVKKQIYKGVDHKNLFFVTQDKSNFTRALFLNQEIPIPRSVAMEAMLKFESMHKDHVTWITPQERYGCRGFRFAFTGVKTKAEFLSGIVVQMLEWHRHEVYNYINKGRGKICLPIVLPLSKYKGTRGYHIARCLIDALVLEDFDDFIRNADSYDQGLNHKYKIGTTDWLPDAIAINAGVQFGKTQDLRANKQLKIKSYAYENLECSNNVTDIEGISYVSTCACGAKLEDDNTEHFQKCPMINEEIMFCGCDYDLTSCGRWARLAHLESCSKSGQIRVCRSASPN